jgi:hypothetical protein
LTKFLIQAASIATLLMPGTAYALTCADYATPVPVANNSFDTTTVPLPVDLVAGDAVTISISWERTTVTPATATITLRDGSTTLGTASMTVGGSGTFTSFAAITVNTAMQYPDAVISVPNTNSYNTYSVRMSCTPAVPDSGGGGNPAGASSSLDAVQQTQTQASALRSAGMISGMARGGIDAAFSSGDNSSIMAFGYAGSAIIDVTPTELASGGFNLWTAASYEFALPQAGLWSGGQASVAGGLNYRVDERWILGVFAAYDQVGYTLGADSVANQGLALGVTAAYRLDDTWRVELIGAVERLRYDLGTGPVTGSFDATRVTLDGAVKGIIPVSAQIDFVPTAALMVLHEEQAAYVDSASVAHSEYAISSSQLSAGARFVFYPTGGIDAAFSLGGEGAYSIAATGGGFGASIAAGVVFTLTPAARLSLNAALNGLASSTGQSISLQAKLGGQL